MDVQEKLTSGHKALRALECQFPEAKDYYSHWDKWHNAKALWNDFNYGSESGFAVDYPQIKNQLEAEIKVFQLVDEGITAANQRIIDYVSNLLEKYQGFFNGEYKNFSLEMSLIQADFDQGRMPYRLIGERCKEIEKKITAILEGKKKEIDQIEKEKSALACILDKTRNMFINLNDENRTILDGIVFESEAAFKKHPRNSDDIKLVVTCCSQLVAELYEIEEDIKKESEMKQLLESTIENLEFEIKKLNKAKRFSLEILLEGARDSLQRYQLNTETNTFVARKINAATEYFIKTKNYYCK